MEWVIRPRMNIPVVFAMTVSHTNIIIRLEEIMRHLLLLLLVFSLAGCESTASNTTIDYESQGYFDPDLFSEDLTSDEDERVRCTLNNGTVTTCYKITFNVNGVGDDPDVASTVGPFCPANIDTTNRADSGFGFYDGSTNPGFQLILDAVKSMEDDNEDWWASIVDGDGNINTNGKVGAACLSMDFKNNQTITYLVPVVPDKIDDDDDPWYVEQVSNIGFGVHGVPYKGNPPSVTKSNGRIPALDHCGGHADPAGYYHWHFIPQSMNLVLGSNDYGFTDDDNEPIECQNSYIVDESSRPNPSAFAGLAKDGYPIYGALDYLTDTETTEEPTNLDDCNGHEHDTEAFGEVYHYHAYRELAPNHPKCLKGLFVNDDDNFFDLN